MTTSRHRRRPPFVVVTAAVLATAFFGLGTYRPLTTHEGLAAQTAREMLAAGSWLRPLHFGEPRWQKPPLAYWLPAAAFAVAGGRTECLARFPSAAAGCLLAGVLSLVALHRCGRGVAWRVALVQVTTLWHLTHAKLAETDMLLAAAVGVALAAWLLAATPRCGLGRPRETVPQRTARRIRLGLACAAAGGLAVLAKGPVAFVFLAGAPLAYRVWRWWRPGTATDGVETGPRFGVAAVGLFIAVAAAWPTLVLLHHPEAAAVWWAETAVRVAADPHAKTYSPLYYVWAALWTTLPWTPLWLSYRWRRARRRRTAPLDAPLVCWLLAPLVLLTLSAGKQEHYLIPALAPASLWAALAWRRWDRTPSRRRASTIGAALVAATALVAAGWIQPFVHGRRAAADWAAAFPPASCRSTDDDAPLVALVALTHGVQWLAFYVEPPLTRVDSLEELRDRFAGRTVVLLTPAGLVNDLAALGTVRRVETSPPDPGQNPDKRPAAVRLSLR
ncbi:MAG: ArnT family glycosyltransferase [Planctomycetia bacterium]